MGLKILILVVVPELNSVDINNEVEITSSGEPNLRILLQNSMINCLPQIPHNSVEQQISCDFCGFFWYFILRIPWFYKQSYLNPGILNYDAGP